MLDVDCRGALTLLTSVSTPDIYPSWSPDGTRMVYGASDSKQGFGIYVKPVTTAGESARLEASGQAIPADWSRDGRSPGYRNQVIQGEGQDLALPLDGNRKPIAVAQTPADQRTGEFSPTASGLGSSRNESGAFRDRRSGVPGAFGENAGLDRGRPAGQQWGPEGRELFYIAPEGRLMSVSLRL